MTETCSVCKRTASNLSYAVGDTVHHVCSDVACVAVVHVLANQDAVALNKLEAAALYDGGGAGGRYLDSIEQCDLSLLTGEQFREFLGHVLAGYISSLRSRLLAGDAPF